MDLDWGTAGYGIYGDAVVDRREGDIDRLRETVESSAANVVLLRRKVHGDLSTGRKIYLLRNSARVKEPED